MLLNFTLHLHQSIQGRLTITTDSPAVKFYFARNAKSINWQIHKGRNALFTWSTLNLWPIIRASRDQPAAVKFSYRTRWMIKALHVSLMSNLDIAHSAIKRSDSCSETIVASSESTLQPFYIYRCNRTYTLEYGNSENNPAASRAGVAAPIAAAKPLSVLHFLLD